MRDRERKREREREEVGDMICPHVFSFTPDFMQDDKTHSSGSSHDLSLLSQSWTSSFSVSAFVSLSLSPSLSFLLSLFQEQGLPSTPRCMIRSCLRRPQQL